MHHDARWKQEFEQTRSGILQSCAGRVIDVQHIGGTALPGLIARPIIDVAAVVGDAGDTATCVDLIEGLNFRRVDPPAWATAFQTRPLILVKPRHGETTHRVFLVSADDRLLQRAIRLRDQLRDDHAAALRFESLKVARWRAREGVEDDYESDKPLLFAHVEEQLGG